jgi:UDP-glucose:(heptosyl)LPS alpha-1,3-glucosyltransferase
MVKADLMRTYRVPESAICVIPDGVDTLRFHPGLRGGHRAAVRAAFGIPPEAPCVLFVGNGFRRKGLDILIQALARLADPAWHLLVVGGDPEAPRYKALADRAGLAGRAVFAGAQAEPERFYGAADLLALPAVQEAFGNVVLEAMACGLPVVVSRGAGSAGLLRNGLETGLLEDPRNPDELARRIQAVFSTRGAGAPAARGIAEALSDEVNTVRTESLLEDVAREIKSGAGNPCF